MRSISWTDAQAYLDWLSGETGHEYRLLTSAEWEYAAQVAVGSLWPNNHGLQDMHGNAWEWIEDCSQGPSGWLPADVFSTPVDCDFREKRGGWLPLHHGWIVNDLVLGVRATERNNLIGFRVARTLTDGVGLTTTLTDEGHEELLHRAAQADDVSLVEYLLEQGVDPDVTQDGVTPLFSAAFSPGPNVLPVLMEAGADPDFVYEGETPLLATLGEGFGGEQAVTALLDGGADVTARRSDGRTALHLAVEHRRSGLMISTLLNAGADSDLSALQLASLLNDSVAVASLLAQGVDPDEPDHLGWTPLHFAMFQYTPVTINMLLDGGADPNALDAQGRPPLIRFYDVHRSFGDYWPPWQDGEDEIAVVDALLRAGADPNLGGTETYGRSALHEAVVRARHTIVVHLLLEAGADPYAQDNRGDLPIDLAPDWMDGTNVYQRLRPLGEGRG